MASKRPDPSNPTFAPAAFRLLGGGLLLATGAIHLDLYFTGYRHIPTIGTLFLLQVTVAFGLALLVAVVRRPTVALAGAGFAAATLGGYILSLWTGLFGFHEVRTAAGIAAGLIEIAAFATLGTSALSSIASLPERHRSLHVLFPPAFVALGTLALLTLVFSVADHPGAPGGTREVANGALGGSAGRTTSINVSIKNFAFSPATFTVSPGERIVVTNHDSVDHTFTATPGSNPQGKFNTGDIGPGKTAVVTAPTKPGAYAFYCQIHNFMTGTLTVR